MSLERIREWAAGKPIGLVSFAWEIVRFAQVGRDFSEMIASGSHWKHFPQPAPTAEWLAMYREHHSLNDAIADLAYPARKEPRVSVLFREFAAQERRFSGLPYEERKAQAEATITPEFIEELRTTWAPIAAEQLNEQLAGIAADVTDQETEGEREIGRAVGTVPLQFHFAVTLPCWLYCGDYPGRVLRRARGGDMSALEMLLRIDKAVIADPKIGNEFHLASKRPHRARFERLVKALRSYPKRLSHKQVRVNLAGLISKFAQGLNHPLTAPQIQALFDAFAVAYRRKPFAKDHFLPDRPDTLARVIWSSRQRWSILPDPERNRG